MENKNIMNLTTAENNAKAMAGAGTVDTKTMQAQSPQQPLPPITMKTTLGELLAMLDLGEKPPVPTPRELFETAGEPIAKMRGCTLFRNGYAIYQNTTGRTVVWLPYCKNFTYRFNKLKDSEKDTLKETYSLPEGYILTSNP